MWESTKIENLFLKNSAYGLATASEVETHIWPCHTTTEAKKLVHMASIIHESKPKVDCISKLNV